MRVLIVDDSATMRRIVRNNLKFAGDDDAGEAGNGGEGLACLAADQIGRGVTDWNMPEMTGIQMVQAVREESALNCVKLMMVTTETEMAHMQQALDAGASALTPLDEARRAFERDYLVRILKITGGNVTKAARLAGRNRTEFYRLLERHSLEPGVFKAA